MISPLRVSGRTAREIRSNAGRFIGVSPANLTPVDMSSPNTLNLTIPSETSAGHAAQEQILALVVRSGFPEHDMFSVRLALEEALVNAIKHGNQLDSAKQVRIRCVLSADAVEIEIEDEGEGFDPATVPDPTLDENLERPSGRGLMLIRSFMTDVEFRGRGNRIWLRKQRSAE